MIANQIKFLSSWIAGISLGYNAHVARFRIRQRMWFPEKIRWE
jgi:hypothetical protein